MFDLSGMTASNPNTDGYLLPLWTLLFLVFFTMVFYFLFSMEECEDTKKVRCVHFIF